MTLVLSVATPAYSLQVGDRLVSKAGKPFDALANKNVVLRATDGLLIFGYTGPAYLDGLPTDVWIADRVSGGACAEIGGTLAFGSFPVRDVGSSLLAISRQLQGDAWFRDYGGEICAVGWQWDGKREGALVRDVLWLLRRNDEKLRWTQLVPRHLPERNEVFRMTATGNWTETRQAWQELLDAVGGAGADWERVQALLVEAIRSAARDSPGTIGAHCMSILVRPWMFPNVPVRFLPETPHLADAMGQSVEVSYSPWMVAPDSIHAPAVSVGGLSCEQGALNYSIEVPEPPAEQRLKGAFQSQERPAG
jgi:hypothetical protein